MLPRPTEDGAIDDDNEDNNNALNNEQSQARLTDNDENDEEASGETNHYDSSERNHNEAITDTSHGRDDEEGGNNREDPRMNEAASPETAPNSTNNAFVLYRGEDRTSATSQSNATSTMESSRRMISHPFSRGTCGSTAMGTSCYGESLTTSVASCGDPAFSTYLQGNINNNNNTINSSINQNQVFLQQQQGEGNDSDDLNNASRQRFSTMSRGYLLAILSHALRILENGVDEGEFDNNTEGQEDEEA